ncbi:hypothetical protein [Uliginosibacterium sp. H1]|uniref:hypothetical protein n=1 Tax=Uliginosibacterium sp. H1 TaxID=3114757 RepID=UPI002E17816A|nr:hypothetical protein [Uliginosibacterium sp. H1]
MAGFEDYGTTASQIAAEIERKLIALGVDWRDEGKLRELAREAFAYDASKGFPGAGSLDPQRRAKVELYGLVVLMMMTMEESANHGLEVRGNDAWRAIGKALWTEKEGSARKGA